MTGLDSSVKDKLQTFNTLLRGTSTQTIIRSEAKGACVVVAQQAPACDYSGFKR
ncbi:hypothetical protein AltI4_09840 [Alteromonas sp. I4]|nr:hypothetical protein AltI4_09840 [Alteromonas sp. I4]